jgi:Lon protease-like protein
MLPLFPLDTVLFPGCVLDLQLFEARYLDMISRCLKQGQGFGVVGILQGSEVGSAPPVVAGIGCEARVCDWEQLPNGLLGIRVEGSRRFQVTRSEVLPDQLMQAEVHWLETPPERPLQEEHEDLLALLELLAEHPHMQALGLARKVEGQWALGDRLGYLLPLSMPQKLELLGMTDAGQRLEAIQRWIEQLQQDA